MKQEKYFYQCYPTPFLLLFFLSVAIQSVAHLGCGPAAHQAAHQARVQIVIPDLSKSTLSPLQQDATFDFGSSFCYNLSSSNPLGLCPLTVLQGTFNPSSSAPWGSLNCIMVNVMSGSSIPNPSGSCPFIGQVGGSVSTTGGTISMDLEITQGSRNFQLIGLQFWIKQIPLLRVILKLILVLQILIKRLQVEISIFRLFSIVIIL
jgi:hypothetical protein